MSNLKSLNCPNCGATVPIPAGTKRSTLSVGPDTGVTAQATDTTPKTVVCPNCNSTLQVPADTSGPQIAIGGNVAAGDMTVINEGGQGENDFQRALRAKIAAKLAAAGGASGGQSVVSGCEIVNRKIIRVNGQPFDPKIPAHKAAYESRKARGVVD